MTELLTDDEIERLLNEVNAAYEDDKEESGDFNTDSRPEKFSREQMREISLIHENFARMAAKSLSTKLCRTFRIAVASTDQLYMGEFLRTIPAPTTLGVIDMNPLKGSAVLEIDPSITFAIIDKICNSSIVSTKSWHELTDNEKFLMKGIYAGLLDDLRDAWYKLTDLKPRLDRIETDPRFIKLVPPSEGVVLITFEAKMDDVEGMMNFCIPYSVIERVKEEL